MPSNLSTATLHSLSFMSWISYTSLRWRYWINHKMSDKQVMLCICWGFVTIKVGRKMKRIKCLICVWINNGFNLLFRISKLINSNVSAICKESNTRELTKIPKEKIKCNKRWYNYATRRWRSLKNTILIGVKITITPLRWEISPKFIQDSINTNTHHKK